MDDDRSAGNALARDGAGGVVERDLLLGTSEGGALWLDFTVVAAFLAATALIAAFLAATALIAAKTYPRAIL